MASNGQLPQSDLARIYHPSYTVYLAKTDGCAAAWNTMQLKIWKARKSRAVYPLGPNSAYRTYAKQVEFKQIYGDNAATPGTSNHGWGLAVDLISTYARSLLDRFGSTFGWAKRWSDASWEWWHIKFRAGVWRRRPNPGPSVQYPLLRRGSGGPGQRPYVHAVRRHLRRKGFPNLRRRGPYTRGVERCVKEFQQRKSIRVTGTTNVRTWRALRK